ncbi:hypothetical protein GYMLUDRAFT_169751 [Collybiopsis luxurians FD-317 M1]|uniref:Uncharacterized protein n=1 Tax=Collybiopsis luxurians FD-317 M1 TaxID=944289 RepID=A0A0D0C9S8_9AGAR|nr:hypothetical protein GYMLUDRAFT_169751 [Collybiopsis luxurians FD-317 M1]
MGSWYTLPQIRRQPVYPHLKHDGKAEVNKEGSVTCQKYYDEYSQKRLTGDIMACWCSHSICYGFHCIPIAEGQNDVFLALVTQWPKAPDQVVYDFACALGPYCWTREPDYFADTQFVIDRFHLSRHTKCSNASFLKTYADVDPALSKINSSAAECGNSGLAHIRKSISYMGQERAILYCWVFLCIWNCQ